MTQTVTFERMVGAAMEHFAKQVEERFERDKGLAVAIEGAARDTVEHVLTPVYELLRDVEAHNEWETTVLDIRTKAGSWRDVAGYFDGITGNAP